VDLEVDVYAQAREALHEVIDPEVGLPIDDLGMIPDVRLKGKTIQVELAIGEERSNYVDGLRDQAAAALSHVDGIEVIEIAVRDMTQQERDEVAGWLRNAVDEQALQFARGNIPVIAIASGKGGVGKTSVAVNMACALAAEGKRVGLVDLDVWGYSVPQMLGVAGTPLGYGDVLLPMQAQGVKVVSVGLLVDQGSLVAWRGPMLHEVVVQFFEGVYWGTLDFLIADLPPGTGDVPMSLASIAGDAFMVIVTTPQELAWQVAQRSGRMAKRAHLRIAGVIENMAGYKCSHCGTWSHPFESGGGNDLADQLNVPLLASIPLSSGLRDSATRGIPLTVADPEHPASRAINSASLLLQRQISSRRRVRLPVETKPLPTINGPVADGILETHP
jgi:ATP-binding protein involved in chromosome partitioning